jgi:hypothetical protein
MPWKIIIILVEPKGFWRRSITLRITRFLDFVHGPEFEETRKKCLGNWISFRVQVGGGRHLLCCVHKGANLYHRLYGDLLFLRKPTECLLPLTWRWKVIQYRKRFHRYLEFRTIKKLHKLSDSEWYTASSQPFIFRHYNTQTYKGEVTFTDTLV